MQNGFESVMERDAPVGGKPGRSPIIAAASAPLRPPFAAPVVICAPVRLQAAGLRSGPAAWRRAARRLPLLLLLLLLPVAWGGAAGAVSAAVLSPRRAPVQAWEGRLRTPRRRPAEPLRCRCIRLGLWAVGAAARSVRCGLLLRLRAGTLADGLLCRRRWLLCVI